MQFSARRVLVAVLAVSLVISWSAAADARAVAARPRGFSRLPRARWRRAAETCAVQQWLSEAREKLVGDETGGRRTTVCRSSAIGAGKRPCSGRTGPRAAAP